MNENLIGISIVVMAIFLTACGLDNGDLIKLVVSAFLGYILGKRRIK